VGGRTDDQQVKLFQDSRVYIIYLERLTTDGIADSLRDLFRIPMG